MEALSYIVLILLSLVGYSGGATGRAGKNTDLKPVLIDLVLVVLIWTVALYSRLTYDFNKWLMILVWAAISGAVGVLAVSFRRWPVEDRSHIGGVELLPPGVFKRIWFRWTGFSKRMGSFQTRVMLSLFFFVIVSPAALFIKVLGDPLQIKKKRTMDTYWSIKKPSPTGLDEYRRQF